MKSIADLLASRKALSIIEMKAPSKIRAFISVTRTHINLSRYMIKIDSPTHIKFFLILNSICTVSYPSPLELCVFCPMNSFDIAALIESSLSQRVFSLRLLLDRES